MATIEYRFVASGQDSVERAFTGIGAAARKNASEVERAYSNQITAARRASRGVLSEEQKAAKEKERALSYVARVRDRHFADEQRQRERAAAATSRQAQREVQERARAVQHVQRIRDRYFSNEQRMAERDSANKARLEQRLAREREKSERYVQRIRDRHVSQEQRNKERAASYVAKIRDRHFADEQRQRDRQALMEQRFNERLRESRSRNMGRIGGELRGAALGGAAGVMASGVAVAGAAVKDAYGLQGIANRLSINSRKSGQDFIDAAKLRKEFEATALATNGVVSAEEVGQGISGFVTKTGRLDLARQFASTFATTSAATGASFEHVASAGAELTKKMGIETAAQMQEALAAITFGGKEGAFELADAAQKYAKLASAGATFGLDKGVGGVRVLQGLSQIAMDSTGDRDVATTAVEAMFRQLTTESKAIERLGVNVFTDRSRTKARPVERLLPEILAATGGDKVLLQDIFKDEGKRAINPLIDTYTRAYQGATGKGGKKATEAERVAAGKAAVESQLQGAINAPGTWADMKLDAEQATQGPGAKFAATWERTVAAVGDKLLPILDRMIDRFEVSSSTIDAFVGTLEVMLEAVEAIGGMFGMFSSRASDPAYGERAARKALDRATTELATLPSAERAAAYSAKGQDALAKSELERANSPEVQAKRAKLEAAKRAAETKLGALEGIDRAGGAVKSKEEFVSQYLGLGDKGNELSVSEARATELARSIVMRPAGEGATKELFPGETDEQRRLRLGYAQGLSEQRIQAGGKADVAGADVAAKGLGDAIRRLTSDMNALSPAIRKAAEGAQPSISTG